MRVAHKDKWYNWKVIILNERREALEQLSNWLLPGLQGSSQHVMEILQFFLHLLGMVCNESLSLTGNIERGKKICCFCNVKVQDCLHTVGHEIWGVTNRQTDSDMVSPKDEGSHVDPFRVFIIAHLHEGFANVEVFALNNAIGLGFIWRTLDMMYAVFFRQVSNCCYKCGAIVSNNFSHSTICLLA